VGAPPTLPALVLLASAAAAAAAVAVTLLLLLPSPKSTFLWLLLLLLLGPATVLRFTRRRASRYAGVCLRAPGGRGSGGSPPELPARTHPRLSLALMLVQLSPSLPVLPTLLSLPNLMVALGKRMLLPLLLLLLASFSSLSRPNDRRRRLRQPPLSDEDCFACGGCC
jgi:hypothetical protein